MRSVLTVARLLILAAVAMAGCKSSTLTVIDVTVEVDAALALDTVSIAATAPGKNFTKDKAAAATVQVSLQVTDLPGGSVVTLESRGLKGNATVVLDRARVAVVTGQRAALTLRLTSDCANVLSCTAEETCKRGACASIPGPQTDGGVPDASGTGGRGGSPGTGGGGAGGGGGPGGAGGSGGQGGGPQMCGATQHNCSGTCVDNNSIDHCGASCTPCTPPTGATATCDGTMCDFTCGATMKKCPGVAACLPASACCTHDDCTAQGGGRVGTCDSSTHSCNYDCPANTKACTSGGTTSCIPLTGCCTSSDCTGTCQLCSSTNTCGPATSRDDPTGRCAGTCDATGACKSKKGQTCQTTPGGCIAGTTCAPDGYCCDQACDSPCMACDIFGFEGTCRAVASGQPHGNRAACAGGGTPCAGACAGRTDGRCEYPTGNCGSGPTCSSTSFVGQSTCSAGSCMTPAPMECTGSFICAAGACKTTCSSPGDCLPGRACRAGACTVPTPGSILWARSASTVFLYGVAESSSGVVVTGSFTSPANLGGSLLSPVGATDSVLAQFAIADGAHLYSNRFGGSTPAGTGYVYGRLDMLDSSGAPLIYGASFCNPAGMPACTGINVGQGILSPGGGPGADGFLGRYSVTNGTATWSRRLVGPGEDQISAVATGPSSSIYVGGWFDQDTTLTGGAEMRSFSGQGDRDILIAQLNGVSGEITMSRTFAGPGFEQPTSIVWTGSHIIVAGFFAGSTVFGSQTLSSMDFDIWVAKLAPDLSPLWAVRFGGAGPDKYPQIAVDAAGDIYLTAFVTGSAMFGTYAVGGTGGTDAVVAKLNSSDGGVAWAKTIGSPANDEPGDIVVSSSGQVLVAVSVEGPIPSGIPFSGGSDVALVSYNGTGTTLWTKVIGTAGSAYSSGVTSGVGAFYANVNLDGDVGSSIDDVPIIGATRPTGLILKLQP